MNNLVAIASNTSTLYANINGYECPSTLFKSKRSNETNAEMYRSRPDIIREINCITVIELTCPFETNLLSHMITKSLNTRISAAHFSIFAHNSS